MSDDLIHIVGGENLQLGDVIFWIRMDVKDYWGDWAPGYVLTDGEHDTRAHKMDLNIFHKGYRGPWEFKVKRAGHNTSSSEPYPNLFPHICPRCKGPAYIGFATVECQRSCA